MGIDLRGPDITVPQKLLSRMDVIIGLEQVTRNLNHYRAVPNPHALILIQLFLLKYSLFYSLMPLSYHDQSSLIHNKW